MVMDKEVLQQKLANLKSLFDSLTDEKTSHDKRSSEIEAELFRLQGDYRTLQQLINETPVVAEQPPISEANTIVAKPKEEVEDGKPTSK